MVAKNGDILRQVNFKHIVVASVFSFLIHVFNGLIFWCNISSLKISINFFTCQRINAWSSMANALGGLPIGVAGKLIAASRIAKTPLMPLVYGQFCYTFVFLFVFLLAFFVSLLFSGGEFIFVFICAFLLFFQLSVIVLFKFNLLNFGGRWLVFSRSLSGAYGVFGIFSVVVSGALMLVLYLYLIYSLSISPNFWLSLSFISLALLIAMAIGFSGVGGLLELILGGSAWLSGLELMQGVEIGLIVRCAAIISSGAWLLILFLAQKFKA